MYRNIEDKLSAWKSKKNKKPLIVKGARQVGKTHSILTFAKKNYESVININFECDEDIRNRFEASIQPSEILNYLEIKFLNSTFEKGKTLIYLDELQACPRAITSLKFLAQESPYDIIASGSMLGVAIASSTSYPVGYVETIELLPMNFEEFLYACGIKQKTLTMLAQHFENGTKVDEGIHNIMNDYLIKYILCGGMPAVVKSYIETFNYQNARVIQKQIMNEYAQDMAKYASHDQKIKVHECFSSIPLQLAKENKKFQYKLVHNGGSARHYESSLTWLEDSGLIHKIYRLKAIDDPLFVYQELNVFKVYMFDIGLLLSQLEESAVKHIVEHDFMIYKGAIFENLAAQVLKSRDHKAYYFEPSSRSEIDFIISLPQGIIPVEIKSSANTFRLMHLNSV